MVVEMLKEQYRPCEPIVLSDMKWLKISSGALRQTFKRMSDKGILKRYMNGVYYFPDNSRSPSLEDVLYKMYIGNRREVYGYRSGYAFANELGVTEKADECPIIVTNKENSRGRFRKMVIGQVYLKKPYRSVTEDNANAQAVLDFIREWEVYSDLSEEDTFTQVKKYMKRNHISKEVLAETAEDFPGRVSMMIVKHRLI